MNYLAPALLMSRLLPAMQQRSGSRIVNVASVDSTARERLTDIIQSLIGQPLIGQPIR